MVDERTLVIRDLLLRLEACGIAPEEPWEATFMPGLGWTFEQSVGSASPSSFSAGTGGANATKVQTRSGR